MVCPVPAQTPRTAVNVADGVLLEFFVPSPSYTNELEPVALTIPSMYVIPELPKDRATDASLLPRKLLDGLDATHAAITWAIRMISRNLTMVGSNAKVK